MTYIHLINIMTVIIFAMLLYILKYSRLLECFQTGINFIDEDGKKRSEKAYRAFFVLLLLTAFISRMICAVYFDGHSDLTCFKYWASRMFSVGPSNFYTDEVLTDYPPGYMYILAVVGAIRSLLGIAYDSVKYTVLVKTPPMIADILTAILIYRFALKRWNKKQALILMCIYLFNPVIYLNSAVWGQVDSVFTLTVLLVCWFVYVDKLHFAYFAYGIGLMIKPQMSMFTPVLIFALFEKVFIKRNDENNSISLGFSMKNLKYQMTYCIPAIIMTFVIALPFGLVTVIKQFFDTMGSYPYASVNAYNLWAAMDLDWAPQTDKLGQLTYAQWGMIFIAVIVITSALIWLSNFNDRTRYIFIAIFICAGMFTLSVRMHERYIYPAIVLLIILFMLTRKMSVFFLYTLYTIAHFYNAAHVLFFYDPYNFDGKITPIILTSLFFVVIFGFLVVFMFKNYIVKNDKDLPLDSNILPDELIVPAEYEMYPPKTVKSLVGLKIKKIDWILMSAITIIYALIAFYNLGDKKAPTTSFSSDEYYSNIIIQLPKDKVVDRIVYYNGNYEEREFDIFFYKNNPEDEPDYSDHFVIDGVFRWDDYDRKRNVSFSDDYYPEYIKLQNNNNCDVIFELGLYDEEGKLITPVNMDDPEVAVLFDEQDLIPDRFTYRNSTYFDEIYHARTAYEYINGLYSYENTHPPFGKFLISLGMRIFGVNPFGWRFAGTLFGVLMLPLMYMFGLRMFRKTEYAAMTTILMASDFMHFAQTRIATIDVFVTFFVIGMYYFMYKYYTMSFYDTPLKKTFIPLGLSGIMMGLGCASKWPGVYAGAGLGVIFFYTMYVRYTEYRKAKADKEGSSNGISNSYIADNFYKLLAKTLCYCVAAFVIVPGVIYTLSYIPFVGCNESPKGLIGRMLYNQKQMFDYHTSIEFTHSFSSRWFEWPIMSRPIWYYSGSIDEKVSEGISSFGNPLIWWFGIIAFFYIAYRAWKKRDKTSIFLTIGYLAQLLPWILVERTTFIYHYFPSVVFVVLMDVYCIYLWVKNKPSKRKKYAVIFTGVAVMLFVLFYPVLSGMPISRLYVIKYLRWFKGWVLI